MLSRLFPQRADNGYRGHRLALWLFGLLLAMKTVISLNSIFNTATVASSADGIPLGTYPAAASATLLALFALLALSHLVVCLLGIIVLARYRSLVPLMLVLFLLEHAGRSLLLRFLPIVRAGAPPAGVINLALLLMMIAGLLLSLWNRGNPAIA